MQKDKSKFRQGLRDFFIASDAESNGKVKDRVSGLRNYVNKIKPNFSEGGKFAKLQSTFEAFESFLSFPTKPRRKAARSAMPST